MNADAIIQSEIANLLQELDIAYNESDATQLLELDSMKSIKLIVALESKFNIIFDDEEMMLELFSTLGNIVSMVCKKRSA